MTRARGFTLVELLVSLVVLALIGLLMSSGVGAGRRAWERVDRSSANIDQVEAAQTIIRDRLARLVPLTRYDAITPYSDIEGKHDVLFFIAPAPYAQQPDALTDYRLSLSTRSELVLSATGDLAPLGNPQRQDRVLLRGVATLDLGYFGPQPTQRDPPRWTDHWPPQAQPPQLIRVRLTFAPGDRRRWPDLIVHPQTTIDTQCVINIQTGKCKGR